MKKIDDQFATLLMSRQREQSAPKRGHGPCDYCTSVATLSSRRCVNHAIAHSQRVRKQNDSRLRYNLYTLRICGK